MQEVLPNDEISRTADIQNHIHRGLRGHRAFRLYCTDSSGRTRGAERADPRAEGLYRYVHWRPGQLLHDHRFCPRGGPANIARVYYDEPHPIPIGTVAFLDSKIVLYIGPGNWAGGRCTVDYSTGLGLCTV